MSERPIAGILSMLREASVRGAAKALGAPGASPISYPELIGQVEESSRKLAEEFGIRRQDRVAIVVPNGPCAATAFLGVAESAVAAPLNPAFQKPEFEYFLRELGARALLVDSGLGTASRDAAQALGIPVLELVADGKRAGLFTLVGKKSADAESGSEPHSQDPCLALHTSGTTSRAKLVMQTHGALVQSARNIARTYSLSSSDRTMNIMPLFHVHGLVGVMLATLGSGGTVQSCPGLRLPDFFDWMKGFAPTWYSAVPTMHQAILAEIASSGRAVAPNRLRFIRSASAALPEAIWKELEKVFHAPVVQAYGMTEGAHQITTNPLPPAARKPGSVGVISKAGPEVAISPEGEVLIRGFTVTSGYEGNAQATREAFSDGWFKTGDLGHLDQDGYLFLSGRLKEVINRGGEKISPLEIDAALYEHPSVGTGIAFATPHPTLGEEVAAAVIPKDGKRLTEEEILLFLRGRLAEFKLPKQVLVVSELPKTPTGKVQRRGLYQEFKDRLSGEKIAPRSPLEEKIAAIWKDILKVDEVGVFDNFFSLGGDSLQALNVIVRAKAAGIAIDPTLSLKSPTVAGLAAVAKQSEGAPEAPGLPSDETRASLWTSLKKMI